MNKFVIPILLISVIFIAGCASQQPTACTADAMVCPDGTSVGRTGPNCEFKCPTNSISSSSGNTLSASTLPAPTVKEFNVTAKKYEFIPGTIIVNKGDQVVINAVSLDVTHGISIPEYNIVETLNPDEPKIIRFTADKAGQFIFSCPVFCGSGHSSMSGTLIVNP
ncbi:MAG TPA: cupredoxin domain-containing protein [archaeon]|nr:cupredoxin domain-containing protein [archaeon]